jgi:hypothetical protein
MSKRSILWIAILIGAVLSLAFLMPPPPKEDAPIVRISDEFQCVGSGKEIEFLPSQPKHVAAAPARSPLSPLIGVVDDKNVVYDFWELRKRPVYNDFMLRAECARMLLELSPGPATLEMVTTTDCAAIKRMRDDHRLTPEKFETLKGFLAADTVLPPAQIEPRLQNLTACFEDTSAARPPPSP